MTDKSDTETLIITINGQDIGVRADFGSSPEELLEAIGWKVDGVKSWTVYRDESYVLTDEHECSEPMVVSDGDEFVVVPETTIGG
ncbi:hypothetical protein [Halocatena halophila]|uniref:hypothetical protein n=1 Tax=Halocatena halophila TaxID=2814576 RepID=UPI002ED6B114